jgi:Ankyrin repeats (3 copies)
MPHRINQREFNDCLCRLAALASNEFRSGKQYSGAHQAIEDLLATCNRRGWCDEQTSHSIVKMAVMAQDWALLSRYAMAQIKLEVPDLRRRTVAHMTAVVTGAEGMRTLAGLGVQLDAQDSDGNTPAHFAAWTGNAAAITELARSRVCLTAANFRGETPLHFAVYGEHLDTVKALYQSGASLDITATHDGPTLRQLLASRNGDAVVEALCPVRVSREPPVPRAQVAPPAR